MFINKHYLAFNIFFICCLVVSILSAQSEQPLRVEIEVSASESYNIIPANKYGVLLFYNTNKNKDKYNNIWIFDFYDTEFDHKWTREMEIPAEFVYRKNVLSADKLYLYFENLEGKSVPLKFKIMTINLKNNNCFTTSGEINERLNISEFNVLNNKVILAGRSLPSKSTSVLQTVLTFTFIPAITNANLLKFHSSVYIYDLNTKIITNVDLKFKGQSWIECLQIDTMRNDIVLISRNFIPSQYNALHITKIDTSGKLLSDFVLLSPDKNKKINTAKIINASSQEKIIAGTYNNYVKGKMANPAFTGFNEKSNGIFLSNINNDSITFIKFYNFYEFSDFFNSIYTVDNVKIKKKAVKQQQKGKEIAYNINLLFHNIIVRDNNYIVIAESYYPEYHSQYYTTYDYYGRPVTYSYMVFDGYRYTNALIACFNYEGKLLWEHGFKIWDILTYNLSEKVKVFFDNEDIVLAYGNAGTITSIVIRDNKIISDRDSYSLETNYPDRKSISNYNNGLEYWYDNFFIYYGYQKIKTIYDVPSKNKTVFYFNKVAFN